jgi:uncharacterized protein YggE
MLEGHAMRRLLSVAPVVLAATTFAAGASAQTGGTGLDPLSIRVIGEAQVSALPDQAEMDVGVVTRAGTAREAADQNARATARLMTQIKEQLEAAGTVETVGYSVAPEYRYPREGGEPQVVGYLASNVIRITTSALERPARSSTPPWARGPTACSACASC